MLFFIWPIFGSKFFCKKNPERVNNTLKTGGQGLSWSICPPYSGGLTPVRNSSPAGPSSFAMISAETKMLTDYDEELFETQRGPDYSKFSTRRSCDIYSGRLQYPGKPDCFTYPTFTPITVSGFDRSQLSLSIWSLKHWVR